MASSSNPPDNASIYVVKEEPEEFVTERLFGQDDEYSILVPSNHPVETLRRRLAQRLNGRTRHNPQPMGAKRQTRSDELKERLGAPTWDLNADNTVVLGLETHYHLNHVADIHGLVDAIVFVDNFFTFVEKPMTWADIWLRLPLLKKRFFKFEEFIQTPGINFNEDTCKITVTPAYDRFINKEPFAHKFFRKCSLPHYKSYKFVFKSTNVSALLDEVAGTWYATFGAGPLPTANDFLI